MFFMNHKSKIKFKNVTIVYPKYALVMHYYIKFSLLIKYSSFHLIN